MTALFKALSLLVVAFAVLLHAADVRAADPPTANDLALLRPEAWQKSATDSRAQLKKLAEALVVVAKDETRPIPERRQAIFALGKLGNKESLDFLIANITLRLPWGKTVTKLEQLQQDPCMYALFIARDGDLTWNVVQAVLLALAKPKSREELMALAWVIDVNLGHGPAQAMMDCQIKFEENRHPPDQVRVGNLKAIREFLNP
jgi:hypothetical protein